MALLASVMATAVARARPRSTLTGEACRSDMAPKRSGETKAARAFDAKANGLRACSPCASSTGLNGTNHIPKAAPWIKNNATNSAYSARRIVRSTRTEHTGTRKFQASTEKAFVRAEPFKKNGSISTSSFRLTNVVTKQQSGRTINCHKIRRPAIRGHDGMKFCPKGRPACCSTISAGFGQTPGQTHMNEAGQLSGKVIVVVGGTTGLGLSAARAFVAAGARIVVVGRNPQSAADAKRMLGSAAVALAADATD